MISNVNNSVNIKGRIANDPSYVNVDDNKTIIFFDLCWNNQRYDRTKETWIDNPNYFQIKTWINPKQKEIFKEKLYKGVEVSIINGVLVQDKWINKNDEKCSNLIICINNPIDNILSRDIKNWEKIILDKNNNNNAVKKEKSNA